MTTWSATQLWAWMLGYLFVCVLSFVCLAHVLLQAVSFKTRGLVTLANSQLHIMHHWLSIYGLQCVVY